MYHSSFGNLAAILAYLYCHICQMLTHYIKLMDLFTIIKSSELCYCNEQNETLEMKC